MIRISKVLFAAAASVAAVGGVAVAQDAPAQPAPAPAADAPASDGTLKPADAPQTVTPATYADPASSSLATTGAEDTSAAWPQSMIDRPLTLNAGMVSAAGFLGVTHVDLKVGTVNVSSTAETMQVAGSFGVSDQLTVGASYGITLHDFEAKGPLELGAAFRVAHGQFKAAAIGTFRYNAESEIGYVSGGLAASYQLAPQFAVYTGGPGQLSVGFTTKDGGTNPIQLDLPVGVAVQATPEVYAYAQTSLGTLGLSKADNIWISDVTPVTVGAAFSPSNKLDVGLSVTSFDAQHATDFVAVFGSVRIFAM